MLRCYRPRRRMRSRVRKQHLQDAVQLQLPLYLVCATPLVHVPNIAASYLQLVSPTLPALSCRYEHEKGPADSPRSRGPSGWLIYQGSPHPP